MPKLGFGIETQDMETAGLLIQAASDYKSSPTAYNWSHYRTCWNLAVLRVRGTGSSAKPMPVTRELFKTVAGAENPYKIGWFTNNFGYWHKDYANAISSQNAVRIHERLQRRKGAGLTKKY